MKLAIINFLSLMAIAMASPIAFESSEPLKDVVARQTPGENPSQTGPGGVIIPYNPGRSVERENNKRSEEYWHPALYKVAPAEPIEESESAVETVRDVAARQTPGENPSQTGPGGVIIPYNLGGR